MKYMQYSKKTNMRHIPYLPRQKVLATVGDHNGSMRYSHFPHRKPDI